MRRITPLLLSLALLAVAVAPAQAHGITTSDGPASATASGNVTTGDQSFAGNKRMTGTTFVVDGLMGVGTASPVSKLDVVVGNGTGSRTDVQFRVQNGAAAGTERNLKIGINSSLGNAYLQSTLEGTAHTPIQLNAAGGFVGIGLGATNPVQALDVSGNIQLKTAGNGFLVKEGTNASMGLQALTAGSAVVSTTKVTATSRIQLTSNVDGGTPGWLRVSARVSNTSFTITSSSGTDTSSVAWIIFEPAP